MKIRNFNSTLNLAKASQNRHSDDNHSFEQYFDSIMEKTGKYIRRIVDQHGGKEKLPIEEVPNTLLDDYDDLIDSSYESIEVYPAMMRYIAMEYLLKNEDKIPELLEEVEAQDIKVGEKERYSDDFHQNLLMCLASIKKDYEEYLISMEEKNSDLTGMVRDLEKQYGKAEAMKKMCEMYAQNRQISLINRRSIILHSYNILFGFFKKDNSDLPPVVQDHLKKMGIKSYHKRICCYERTRDYRYNFKFNSNSCKYNG